MCACVCVCVSEIDPGMKIISVPHQLIGTEKETGMEGLLTFSLLSESLLFSKERCMVLATRMTDLANAIAHFETAIVS